VVHVIEPDAWAHGPAMLSSLVPVGAGLFAAATVPGRGWPAVGAGVGRSGARQPPARCS
jgi:hypothetical protein